MYTAFSRPYPPTPSRLFLHITGAKRKLSETRLYQLCTYLSSMNIKMESITSLASFSICCRSWVETGFAPFTLLNTKKGYDKWNKMIQMCQYFISIDNKCRLVFFIYGYICIFLINVCINPFRAKAYSISAKINSIFQSDINFLCMKNTRSCSTEPMTSIQYLLAWSGRAPGLMTYISDKIAFPNIQDFLFLLLVSRMAILITIWK